MTAGGGALDEKNRRLFLPPPPFSRATHCPEQFSIWESARRRRKGAASNSKRGGRRARGQLADCLFFYWFHARLELQNLSFFYPPLFFVATTAKMHCFCLSLSRPSARCHCVPQKLLLCTYVCELRSRSNFACGVPPPPLSAFLLPLYTQK